MSRPKPTSNSEHNESFQARKLGDEESFDDVMAKAPQEARPFQMNTIRSSDEKCVLLINGMYMSYNGVIIDPRDRADPREWLIKEPWRRLDGTIIYGDHWERKNNGVFVAPSGLMIDKNLTLIHRNGHTIFPDGVVVMPNGKMHKGPPNGVGIIYRPGLSTMTGVQHWAIPEPPIDEAVLSGIVPADPSKGIVSPQPHRGFVDQTNSAAPRGPHQTNPLLPAIAGQYTSAEPGKYVPPHVRRGRGETQTKMPEKRLQLTFEELEAFTPPQLHHLLYSCDMDGCGTDVFGIPMCLSYEEKLQLIPYAKEGFNKINSGL